MIRIIKKVGLLLMALTTMITMSSCTELNQQTATEVCNALSQKYNEEFVATKIGDRFNTDHAVLYLYPQNNENIVFSATIDRKTREVSDNYIRRKISLAYSQNLAESMKDFDVEVGFSVMMSCDDPSEESDSNISTADFAKKYSLSHLTLYIPVKNSCVSEKAVSEILSVLQEKQKEWNVGISALVFNISNDRFNECVADMNISPKINSSWFSEYDCVGTTSFNLTDGTINPEIDKITTELTGD